MASLDRTDQWTVTPGCHRESIRRHSFAGSAIKALPALRTRSENPISWHDPDVVLLEHRPIRRGREEPRFNRRNVRVSSQYRTLCDERASDRKASGRPPRERGFSMSSPPNFRGVPCGDAPGRVRTCSGRQERVNAPSDDFESRSVVTAVGERNPHVELTDPSSRTTRRPGATRPSFREQRDEASPSSRGSPETHRVVGRRGGRCRLGRIPPVSRTALEAIRTS